MTGGHPERGFVEQIEGYCRSLCEASWEDPLGPLQLNPKLSSADLQGAVFFQNTRQLLLALQEQAGTAATATGNLNRVGDWPGITEKDSVRITPLFKKFISFLPIAGWPEVGGPASFSTN